MTGERDPDDLLSGVADTSWWMADMRARESERPDAVFRDPHARALAGERGAALSKSFGRRQSHEWAYVVRTTLFDELILQAVQAGADTVLSLAAGLDARPYRLTVPSSLRWIEVDYPSVVEYKNEVLADSEPKCAVERVAMDLSNAEERHRLLDTACAPGSCVVVATEGFLVYLSEADVAGLADELATRDARWWVTDLTSPGLLRMLQRGVGARLAAAGSPLRFAPSDGPAFFEPHGWSPIEVRPMFSKGVAIHRLPWYMLPFRLLPDAPGRDGSRPWSAVVLLERK